MRNVSGGARRVMEVDYLGYVHGTLAALRRMRPNDRGVIVQVGSAMAYWAIPLQATYCAAKFAIRGFIDALRTELLHDGSAVRVDDGAAPRAHHTAVHVGADHAAAPAAAGATRLLARGGSRRDAILHAAENSRRELWVGANVPLIIAGTTCCLDSRTATSPARTWTPSRARSPSTQADRTTWTARWGTAGVHGPFAREAKSRSVQLALSKHKRALLACLTAAAIAARPLAGVLSRSVERTSTQAGRSNEVGRFAR